MAEFLFFMNILLTNASKALSEITFCIRLQYNCKTLFHTEDATMDFFLLMDKHDVAYSRCNHQACNVVVTQTQQP